MSLNKIIDLLDDLSAEDTQKLHDYLGGYLKKQIRKPVYDDRIEKALIYLSERCDGARNEDGQGFNRLDANFGHMLAQRAGNGMLSAKMAKTALKLLKKYSGQLGHADIQLPEWNDVKHQYQECYENQNGWGFSRPEKYIDLDGGSIRVFHPYDPTGEFQKKAKSIKGKFSSSKPPFWSWPEASVLTVLDTFTQTDGFVVSEDVLALAMRMEDKKAKAEDEETQLAHTKSEHLIELINMAKLDDPLPNGWLLMDHQKKGAEWLLARHDGLLMHGGILADDMGLGKTLETLVAAKAMREMYDCVVFVVCPTSLKRVWLNEAEKVGVNIEVFSWGKQPAPLEDQKYLVIADEAHYAQSLKSTRTKKMLKLSRHENCLAVWCVTGTPMKNGRPVNLYPLLSACDHPLASSKKLYEDTYCNAHMKEVKRGKWIYDTTGSSHMNQLAKQTEDVILRRTKAQCLDLPEKTRQYKPAELSSKEQAGYLGGIAQAVAEYKQQVQEGTKSASAEALVTVNAMRRFGSKYKVSTAIEMAEELLEQGQKVVLFTEFRESAQMLHEHLGGELLTGNTKEEDRQSAIDRFQEGESKVFVGTIKAGGVGVTLTAASHNILVDRPWTPGDAVQAEDRCHRVGQTNQVNTYWLQLGTVDFAIDQLLEQKQGRIDLVLKGKRKTLNGINSPVELAKELMEIMG